MTWCKGCKKDLSPLKFLVMETQFCDNCIEQAGIVCESGEYCHACPDLAECEVS